jgi:hypothetical protein
MRSLPASGRDAARVGGANDTTNGARLAADYARIETVEILSPRQPEHHVRVTIHRQATPGWPFLIPAIVVFAFVAGRFLFIPLIVVMAIFTAYPAIGITFALWLVLIIGIAIHQRWRGHPF